MLGLAVLMVILVASISYEPEPADEALGEVLQQFNFVFPDRGKSQSPVGVPPVLDYKATNVTQEADGTAAFTLTVEYSGQAFGAPKVEGAPRPRAPGGIDVFRFAVAAWKKPAGEKMKEDPRRARARMMGRATKDIDVVMPK